VVEWEEHDPSTVYVLFDHQRPSSEPKLRRISEFDPLVDDDEEKP